jgi:hypothetical protein
MLKKVLKFFTLFIERKIGLRGRRYLFIFSMNGSLKIVTKKKENTLV